MPKGCFTVQKNCGEVTSIFINYYKKFIETNKPKFSFFFILWPWQPEDPSPTEIQLNIEKDEVGKIFIIHLWDREK